VQYDDETPAKHCFAGFDWSKTMVFWKKSSGGTDFLVVGLGNPGKEYEHTRHNVGFMVLDELAERKHIPIQRLKYRALTNTASFGTTRALLMKPITYMNLSGESVGEAARFFKLPPAQILIISDDTDLPVGKLRLRRKGSAGGHNGLKSIIAHLGSDEFLRIKVGVGGKPHPDYDMADWVLGRFPGPDQAKIGETIKRAADAVELLLTEGMEEAMSQYNR
jgi:PTH1 family peptidyl-tRNA hydrolase